MDLRYKKKIPLEPFGMSFLAHETESFFRFQWALFIGPVVNGPWLTEAQAVSHSCPPVAQRDVGFVKLRNFVGSGGQSGGDSEGECA